MPKARLYGRKITDFWNTVNTCSRDIKDGMCGFRIYPVAPFLDVVHHEKVGDRMDFDNEILIRLYWRGLPFIWLDTHIAYREEGISHFRLRADNWLISKMHTRLFFGMLAWRLGGGRKKRPRHWSAQRERGSPLFLKISVWLVRYLPLWIARLVSALVAAYFYLTSRSQRRAVRQYQSSLKNHFPDAPLPARFAVYRQFAAFGQAVADRFAVWQRKITADSLVLEDPDGLFSTVRWHEGRGQILICSHLGNMEICRALVSRHPGFKMNVLVYDAHSAEFSQALKAAGASYIQLIQVDKLDAAQMLSLSQKLDAGEWIAIAADRTPVRGNKTVAVDFLGRRAELPQGPWLLAGLLKARTNTIFVLRGKKGRYHLCLKHFDGVPEWTRATREQQIAEAAQRYARLLEQYARRAPLQWFNFYDFWNTPHG